MLKLAMKIAQIIIMVERLRLDFQFAFGFKNGVRVFCGSCFFFNVVDGAARK